MSYPEKTKTGVSPATTNNETEMDSSSVLRPDLWSSGPYCPGSTPQRPHDSPLTTLGDEPVKPRVLGSYRGREGRGDRGGRAGVPRTEGGR